MTSEERGPDAHVVFELAVEDGWPPVAAERVWASHLGDDRYRIDNPPWFVRDIAVGDVVRAKAPRPDAHPVVEEVLERSDHVTIRLICFRKGPLGGDLARALGPFTALGVYGEGASQYGMLALDVEPTAPLPEVVSALRRGVMDGSWEFEEGRITPAGSLRRTHRDGRSCRCPRGLMPMIDSSSLHRTAVARMVHGLVTVVQA